MDDSFNDRPEPPALATDHLPGRDPCCHCIELYRPASLVALTIFRYRSRSRRLDGNCRDCSRHYGDEDHEVSRHNGNAAPGQPASVTKGPFSFSRNPIYLGNTVFTIAIGLIFGALWFLPAGLAAAFAAQKLAIEREEQHLSVKFGKQYRDYCKRVKRWI